MVSRDSAKTKEEDRAAHLIRWKGKLPRWIHICVIPLVPVKELAHSLAIDHVPLRVIIISVGVVNDVCCLATLHCEGRVKGRLNYELICMAHKALSLLSQNWERISPDMSYICVGR